MTCTQWLLSRAELARVDPRYAYPQAAYTNYRADPSAQQWAAGSAYGMHAMNVPVMPPPPMYDPSSAARPPQYDYAVAPPASKVDPAQAQFHPPEWTRRPDADVPPPVGPPPSAVARNETGRSETSNNPFARG